MTKEEMIDKIIDDMGNWDYETLLGWAKDQANSILQIADIEEVEVYYDELQRKDLLKSL